MMHHTRLRHAVALATVITLAACGGDDAGPAGVAAETGTDDTGGNDEPEPNPADQTEPVHVVAGEDSTVLDVLTDAMGEDGDAVRDAIAAVPSETVFEIVADQLDPRPQVEIDGTDIRLVFDGGTVDDATFDCIVAGSFVEAGQTLTVVYPDGEQVC